MKKILILILCLTMMVSAAVTMTSCDGGGDDTEPCTEHIDTDGDGLCDDCETEITDNVSAKVSVTLTVKDTDGNSLPGVTVMLTHHENSEYNATTSASDASGNITAELYTGNYSVIYDYDVATLGYYVSDTTSIEIKEDTTNLELLLVDNNPDGSAAKPFVLSFGDNTVTIPANSSYTYVIYRSVYLYATIKGDGVKVTYNDTDYTPDAEGKVAFNLLGTNTNYVETLVISNTSDAESTYSVNINSAPGSYGNPYVIDMLGSAVTTDELFAEDLVYYTYTATASGTFTITFSGDKTYISMINAATSVNTNSSITETAGVLSLSVNAGDEIIIDCAAIVIGDDSYAVTFTPEFTATE